MERYTDTISGEELYVNTVSNRTKFYYKDRAMKILHRIDGPAFEGANASKEWYVDNKLHRLDGPACEYANGGKEWWVDDKRHRLDGPAIEWADRSKAWSVDGVFIMKINKNGKVIERME